jgi:hypothetical protein
VIPALGRLRQKDYKLEIGLDYIARPCLSQKNTLQSFQSIKVMFSYLFPSFELNIL